jgi:GAF domain
MDQPSLPDSLDELCSYALSKLNVDGVAVVISVQRIPQRVISSAGHLGTQLPDIEFVLGEGPSYETARTGSPVEATDLLNRDHSKWPLFTEKAIESGISSILAFPLERGEVHLGALELYSALPRTMTTADFRSGFAIANRITSILIGLPTEVIDSAHAHNWMSPDSDRIRIHQASGMVAFMLNTSVEEALDRMRAYSFSQNISLLSVANLIISRELRIEP